MNSRLLGIGLNALLRASIAGFLVDVLRRPRDPRYAGKAIPVRNLVIVGSLGHVFPLLHLLRRGRWWSRYPVWPDNMYLSIFWLDMAGNAFNLYDRFTDFDLVPHFHGPGALAIVLLRAFGWPARRVIGVTNVIHGLLEAQEYATDVFCGTHNIRGGWDSAGDLAAGLLGTVVYVGAAQSRWVSEGASPHLARACAIGMRWDIPRASSPAHPHGAHPHGAHPHGAHPHGGDVR